jgi:hypothetical protein
MPGNIINNEATGNIQAHCSPCCTFILTPTHPINQWDALTEQG